MAPRKLTSVGISGDLSAASERERERERERESSVGQSVKMESDNARYRRRAFQFGQKSFDSIRFGNLINLPLVH